MTFVQLYIKEVKLSIIDRVLKIIRIPQLCQFEWVCDFKPNDLYRNPES